MEKFNPNNQKGFTIKRSDDNAEESITVTKSIFSKEERECFQRIRELRRRLDEMKIKKSLKNK